MSYNFSGTTHAFTGGSKVGVGTTAPNGMVTVEKAAGNSDIFMTTYSDSTDTANLSFRKSHNDTQGTKTDTISTEIFGIIDFIGVDTGQNFDSGAQIYAIQDGAAGTTLPTNLIFTTWSSSTQNTNQLVLHNDGSVGIGTVTPAVKLDVVGTINTSSGIQTASTARTATADGTVDGTIANGTGFVTVTCDDANKIIILPAPTPGNIVRIINGATGYELRSSDPATVAINGGAGAGAESAIGANTLVTAVCTSATTWICMSQIANGTISTTQVAAA